MKLRLGKIVARYWKSILFGWGVAVCLVWLFIPKFEDVTVDGDLAYMPSDMPSVQGQAMLHEAFPERRAKSQVGIILARNDGPLTISDLVVADRIALPFYVFRAASGLSRVDQLRQEHSEAVENRQRRVARRLAGFIDDELAESLAVLDEAIDLVDTLATQDDPVELDQFDAHAYHTRSLIHTELGNTEEAAEDARIALELEQEFANTSGQAVPDLASEWPLLDVWTRRSEIVGQKMLSKDRQACLVVLQLSNEFMVRGNQRLLQEVEDQLALVRQRMNEHGPDGLQIAVTGSAAVGADFVSAEATSLKNTELYTVVLVVVILGVLYRSPMLVAVPLLTIGVSLTVGLGIVVLLTQIGELPRMDWWPYEVFSTTRVFIVVILFGAGTDFCLFLIARYREELQKGKPVEVAIAAAVDGVHDALIGSAMTTIVGLGMMYFADFGKFSIAGPTIGICLFVALLACLTLAPALLRAVGRRAFWPFKIDVAEGDRADDSKPGIGYLMWDRLAGIIITYPGRILVVTIMMLTPFAWYGGGLPPMSFGFSEMTNADDQRDDDRIAAATEWKFPPAAWYRQRQGRERFSYDLVAELRWDASSREGMRLLNAHFPIGETGPLVIVAKKEDAGFETSEGMAAIEDLTKKLYFDGVESVRSIAEPLGDYPKRFSLVSPRGHEKLVMRTHPLSRRQYLTDVPALEGDVVRFELLLAENPFSIEATETLNQVDEMLTALGASADPFWQGTQFAYSGTTSGIRDLRTVTRGDNIRIKVLVSMAVLGVLIALIRNGLLSFYLVLSVLFSYYVTLGMTELFFSNLYGSTFVGLDWKVNIFLFVILVAIGQDYNIYLVTRVLEEQRKLGSIPGLRRAIVQTGGIITSCGLIMAGTFASMTTGSLRAMIEMGFSLSLGVLIDTFIIRTLIVPAFLALIFRHRPTSLRIYDREADAGPPASAQTA